MMESNNITKYFNTESYYKILLLQIIFTIPALIIFIQFITSKLILGIYGIFFLYFIEILSGIIGLFCCILILFCKRKNIIVILTSIIICEFNIFSILRFNPNGIYNYYCHICEYIFQIAS